MNIIDFTFSLLNSTLIFAYLAVFDIKLSANTLYAVMILIVFRIICCFLASYSVYIGMKKELAKILSHLGTSINES